MADEGIGFVDVQLDRSRKLRFDVEALYRMEEDLGGALKPSGGVGRIRAMLRAGLLHEQHRLSLQDAGNLINHAPGANLTEKLKYVAGRLELAIEQAIGKEALEEGKKKLTEAGIPIVGSSGELSVEALSASLASSPGSGSDSPLPSSS